MILVIDGNALMNVLSNATTYKANQTAEGAFKPIGNGKRILTHLAKDSFSNFVKSYVHNIAFPFKRILTKIYIAFDTPNWRKVYVNWYFQQPCNQSKQQFVYKQKTVTDDSRERRENLFMYFDHFFENIAPELFAIDGIHMVRANGAEGDDIIAYIYENVRDQDIAIWSVDTDLVQLVEKSNRNVFLMTPKTSKANKKLYICDAQVKIAATEKVNLLSITTPTVDTMSVVDYLIKNKGYKLEIANPIKETLIKILSGDKKSDNIPSAYSWKSAAGLTMTLTEKIAEEIYIEILKEYPEPEILPKIDEYNRIFFERIVSLIADKYKPKAKPSKSGQPISTINPGDTVKLNAILDNLVLNTKLIRLNKTNIPDVIYSRMEASFKESENKKPFAYTMLAEMSNKYKMDEDQFKV